MPTVALTDVTVRNLKPVAGKRITYLDKTLKGFGVMLTPQGHASYVFTFGANRQRVKLGDVGVIKLADARTAARTIAAQRQLGQHQPRKAPAYKTALDDFLEAKKPDLKSRTYADYKRLLTSYGFGQEKLTDITPHAIIKKLQKLSRGERAHAHVALKIFFRWAFRNHLIDSNPMERMGSPPKSKKRSRILSNDELKAIWNACAGMFGDIIKLCILTGQRRGEIVHLKWEWIKEDLITLPSEITKNSREHTFPIGPMARAVIDAQQRRNETPYLFPARKTWRKHSTVYNAWNKDMPKLRTASQTVAWVPHDCRRTFRTKWSELKVPREVAEKYINHITGAQSDVEQIYDRYHYLPEMREAVSAWEAHLGKLVALAQTPLAR
jgi:integrase